MLQRPQLVPMPQRQWQALIWAQVLLHPVVLPLPAAYLPFQVFRVFRVMLAQRLLHR